MAVGGIAQVRAILVDVFGTCVDWRTGVIREGEAFGRAHGLSGVDWAKFADTWRALYQPQMDKVRTGQRPWTKLDDLHRESLDMVLRDFGIAGLPAVDRDDFNRIWHRLDPWPDTIEGADAAQDQVHHRAELKRPRRADSQHGQACWDSVGRNPRRRDRARLQADARGVLAQR